MPKNAISNNPYPGDIVDAKLEPGEMVINRNAVAYYGKENLQDMNESVPRFNKGGSVPSDQNSLKLRRAKEMLSGAENPFVYKGYSPEEEKMMQRNMAHFRDSTNDARPNYDINNPPDLRAMDNRNIPIIGNLASSTPIGMPTQVKEGKKIKENAVISRNMRLTQADPEMDALDAQDKAVNDARKQLASIDIRFNNTGSLEDSYTNLLKKQGIYGPKKLDKGFRRSDAGKDLEKSQRAFEISQGIYRNSPIDSHFRREQTLGSELAQESTKMQVARSNAEKYFAGRRREQEEISGDARDLQNTQDIKDAKLVMQRNSNQGLPGWQDNRPRDLAESILSSDDTEDLKTYANELFGTKEKKANPAFIMQNANKLKGIIDARTEELFRVPGESQEASDWGVPPDSENRSDRAKMLIDDAAAFAMQGYQTPSEQVVSKMRQEAKKPIVEKSKDMNEKVGKLKGSLSKFAGSLLYGQKGGYIPYPDGKQGYLLGGLAALGAAGRGAKFLGDKWQQAGGVAGIKEDLGNFKTGVQGGLAQMKEQAGKTDYHMSQDVADRYQMGEDIIRYGEDGIGDKGLLNALNKGNPNVTQENIDTANQMWQAEGGGDYESWVANDDRMSHEGNAARAIAEKASPFVQGGAGLVKEGAGLVGKAGGALAKGAQSAYGAAKKGAGQLAQGVKDDWGSENSKIKGGLGMLSAMMQEAVTPGASTAYSQDMELKKILSGKDGKDVEGVTKVDMKDAPVAASGSKNAIDITKSGGQSGDSPVDLSRPVEDRGFYSNEPPNTMLGMLGLDSPEGYDPSKGPLRPPLEKGQTDDGVTDPYEGVSDDLRQYQARPDDAVPPTQSSVNDQYFELMDGGKYASPFFGKSGINLSAGFPVANYGKFKNIDAPIQLEQDFGKFGRYENMLGGGFKLKPGMSEPPPVGYDEERMSGLFNTGGAPRASSAAGVYKQGGGFIDGIGHYQNGGAVGFKQHMMYDKNGKEYLAKTYKDHLKMKKMGYTHEGMQKGGMVYRYQDGGFVDFQNNSRRLMNQARRRYGRNS